MKWIKYKVLQSTIDEKDIFLDKKIGHSEANLVIAQSEAYNGEYTIEEDGETFEEKPLPIELGGTSAKTAEEARVRIGAAPANYGLGTYAVRSLESLDDMKNFGVFTTVGMKNVPAGTSFIIPMFGTFAGAGIRGYQKLINPSIGCFLGRFKQGSISNEWSEWEYENPPMEIAADGNNPIYKTTRRWLGKPVYTTMIKTKWNTTESLELNVEGIVIDYCGRVDDYPLPCAFKGTGVEDTCMLGFYPSSNSGKIIMNMYGGSLDLTYSDTYVQIWYIKNSDET